MAKSIYSIVEEALQKREKRVFLLLYKEKKSYKEITEQLIITRERVRQIECSALRKLKKYLDENPLLCE